MNINQVENNKPVVNEKKIQKYGTYTIEKQQITPPLPL